MTDMSPNQKWDGAPSRAWDRLRRRSMVRRGGHRPDSGQGCWAREARYQRQLYNRALRLVYKGPCLEAEVIIQINVRKSL